MFYECTSLASILIPNSVAGIGSSAFYGCENLLSVGFEEGSKLGTIGASAFYECTSLASISIPSGVTSIGNSAFSGCKSLKSVELPSSLIVLNRCTFLGCVALERVYIPSSVTTIYSRSGANSVSAYNYSPFYKCTSSLTIYCGASAMQGGWDTHWNYISSDIQLTVEYNKTVDDFRVNSSVTEATFASVYEESNASQEVYKIEKFIMPVCTYEYNQNKKHLTA